MLRTLIRDKVGPVTAEWQIEHDQDPPESIEKGNEFDLIDVTDHPEGPKFHGRIRNADGSFGPLPVKVKARRQILKEKENWTVADRNEAIRLLL